MSSPTSPAFTARGIAIGLCMILLASLAALGFAMAHVLAETQTLFDRAAASQMQLAAVSRIEALAFDGDRRGLADTLDRYVASIDSETHLLPLPGDQRDERAMARRLRALATGSANRSAIRAQVAAIGARERAEADGVAARMARLRVRMGALTALLTLLAAGSAILGALGLIAANRRLSREVAARTADLSAIDRSRRLFFAKASHEMRTPVTVMRGEAEVTLADPQAAVPQLREALGHVVANAEFLEHRIEELLGLARAEDGRFALDVASVDIVDVVQAASRDAARYARSSGISIDVRSDATALTVSGDARWLGQALLAALDNAIKFSPAGGSVRLSVAAHDAHAVIRIADRGIGVMLEALPRIFDAYYQAEAGQSRGGTGLGLALARWVVEQHGGTIRADNDPAGGCTIRIALPLAAAA